MGFLRQQCWRSCQSLLQGIFQTQGWNPHLLYWRADSLPLSLQGSSRVSVKTSKCLYVCMCGISVEFRNKHILLFLHFFYNFIVQYHSILYNIILQFLQFYIGNIFYTMHAFFIVNILWVVSEVLCVFSLCIPNT